MKVKVQGEPQPQLKFLHDGVEIEPDNDRIKIKERPDGTTSLVIDEAKPEDSGNYTVIASNDLGTATTSAEVTVEPEAPKEEKPQIVVKLKDTAVEQDKPVTLEIKVSGVPQPKLKWFHDGVQVNDYDKNYVLDQQPDGTATLTIEKAIPG